MWCENVDCFRLAQGMDTETSYLIKIRICFITSLPYEVSTMDCFWG